MAGATSRQEVNDQSCLLDCCIEVNEYHVSVAVFFETVAERRIAVLLSGFGFGHIRRYAPFRPHPQRLALHPFCKVRTILQARL